MALSHARPGDVIDLRPLGSALVETPSRALLRTDALELMHLVLMDGERLPQHAVAGESTLQVLEGRVLLDLGDRQQSLETGQLVLLGGGITRAIEALQDSSLLVTLVMPQDDEQVRTTLHGKTEGMSE